MRNFNETGDMLKHRKERCELAMINQKFNGIPDEGLFPTESTKILFNNRNSIHMIDMYNTNKLQ